MLRLFFFLLVLLTSAGAVFSANKYSRVDFPPGFVFGAGTSAYQVEGAANEDGRGPSVWDTYVHEGNSWGGTGTGDVAVDQYHKYKEDVQLMVGTGLDAYRFSISWTRIIPNGRGPVNPKGLQYYNNLINELVSNGIQPHVTLYHYDHPQSLEDEYGGWVSRKIVKDFTAFAEVCFREFGDRVLHWTTLNEPNALALLGYDLGFLPPRRCSPLFGVLNCSKGNSSTEPYLVAHHSLLAHASAARLYRTKYQGRQHGLVGFSVLALGLAPSTNTLEDLMAIQRVNDFFHGLFVNPLVYGDYPDTVKKRVGSRLPTFTERESKLVQGSFDFLGLIHYGGAEVKDYPNSWQGEPRDYTADWGAMLLSTADNSSDISDFQYPIEPWYMQQVLDYFKQAYGNPPIYILENGQRIRRNTSLEDTSRVEYMHAYIGSMLDAVRNGSNVKGYFVWSFLDVFELLEGWQSGYGLYYVDLDDPELKRYPKLSAHWYSNFLKGGAVGPGGVIGKVSSALWSRI